MIHPKQPFERLLSRVKQTSPFSKSGRSRAASFRRSLRVLKRKVLAGSSHSERQGAKVRATVTNDVMSYKGATQLRSRFEFVREFCVFRLCIVMQSRAIDATGAQRLFWFIQILTNWSANYEPGGREFESLRARHFGQQSESLSGGWLFCLRLATVITP